MKRTIRTISILLLILIAAASCRNQTIPDYEYETPTTWAGLFDIFWMKMNTNYLFWNLEYEKGLDWDVVYIGYKKAFDSLGLIADPIRSKSEQKMNTIAAYRLFFNILKDLSDGHYNLQMTDTEGNEISISPYTIRIMRSLGISDERIFNLSVMPSDKRHEQEEYISYTKHESYVENTLNIAKHSFGITNTSESQNSHTVTDLTNSYGFS